MKSSKRYYKYSMIFNLHFIYTFHTFRYYVTYSHPSGLYAISEVRLALSILTLHFILHYC